MKKNVIIFFISITLLFTLVACNWFGGNSTSSNGNNGGNQEQQQEPKTVTVVLDLNGGTGIDRLSHVGVAGSALNLPHPRRDGYTFDNWYNGWKVIDSTVYPSSDTTLVARYVAQNDTDIDTSAQTPLNQELKCGAMMTVAHGELAFEKTDFTDVKAIEYLLMYSDTKVQVNCVFEYRISNSTANFKLTGASQYDIIDTATLSSSNNWNTCSFEKEIESKLLVGSGDEIIKLLCDANVGSSYIYMRNVKITFKFTQKKGMLV